MAEKTAYAGEEIQDGLENRVRELKLDVPPAPRPMTSSWRAGRWHEVRIKTIL